HLVRYGCKGDCSRNCECKRSGLRRTTMCSKYAGESCFNRNIPDSKDEYDTEEHVQVKPSSASTREDCSKRRRF
ncbi:hypothetical protein AVEN_184200-1, partial [Araneus ventricosus]